MHTRFLPRQQASKAGATRIIPNKWVCVIDVKKKAGATRLKLRPLGKLPLGTQFW